MRSALLYDPAAPRKELRLVAVSESGIHTTAMLGTQFQRTRRVKPIGLGEGSHLGRDVELKRDGLHDGFRMIAIMRALVNVTYRDPQDQAVAKQ